MSKKSMQNFRSIGAAVFEISWSPILKT